MPHIATRLQQDDQLTGALGALNLEQLLARFFASTSAPALPRSGALAGPASHEQERIWRWSQQDTLSRGFNIPVTFDVSGPFDCARAVQVMRELLERHAVLRTSYCLQDGALVQRIIGMDQLGGAIRCLDYSGDPQRERRWTRIAARLAHKTFNLATGLPLRVVLCTCSPGQYRVLLVIHHIAVDGASLGHLQQEFWHRYDGTAQRLPGHKGPAYIDVAIQERQLRASGGFDQHRAFWAAHLEGAPRRIDYGASIKRPPGRSFAGRHSPFCLPEAVTAFMRHTAGEQQATMFMVLIALIASALQQQYGLDDVLIGAPSANRESKDTETLVGPFANTIVLRIGMHDAPPFAALVARVRDECIAAYARQRYPFAMVVQQFYEVTEPPDHHPVVQVMVDLASAGGAGAAMHGPLQVAAHDVVTPVISKYDMSFLMTDDGRAVRGLLESPCDLFGEAEVASLLHTFARLAAQLSAAAPATQP